MKKIIYFAVFVFLLVSCGSNGSKEGKNNQASSPIPSGETFIKLTSGYENLGGLAWSKINKSLYFTDTPKNIINKIDVEKNVEKVKSGLPAKGLAFNKAGDLFIAGASNRNITRLNTDESLEIVASLVEGKKFNNPQNLVVHSNGTVFFTDPPPENEDVKSETECSGVYSIKEDFTEKVWCEELSARPDGIVLSPDESKLYVSFGDSGEVWSWDLDKDAKATNKKTFFKTSGQSSGLAIDDSGNLYLATKLGVPVYSSEGKKWGTIETSEEPQRVTIGGSAGNTLYIATKSKIYSIDINVTS